MILPFKKSPWRPVYISVLLCSLLGLLLCCMGAMAALAMVLNRNHPGRNPPTMFFAVAFYLGAGCLYFFCAYWLNRLRAWAAIVALSVSSLFLIGLFIGFIASVVFMFSEKDSDKSLWIVFSVLWFIELLLLTILSLLVITLIRCFSALRILLNESGGGFEVLPAREPEEM